MQTAHIVNKIKTKELYEFIDITEDIASFVEKSEIKNGLVNVQIMHTSAALVFNENEPLLLEDIQKSLEKIASSDGDYKHDDFKVRTVNMCEGECENGHSHCKAIHLPSTITINLIDSKLQLGEWQKVMFLELDRARERSYQILVIGE